MTKKPYIYQTNSFRNDWIWLKRVFAIFALNTGILIVPFGEELWFLKPLLVVIITFYLIVIPIDDLAVDETHLFHIRKSVIPVFTRVDKYLLADFNSIRAGGIRSVKWELVDFFNGAGSNGSRSNTVEMSFKDKSSKSLRLTISRDKLDKIVGLVYELKNK